MIVSDYAIKNRIVVLVLAVLIVLMGLYSYVRTPRESMPDVEFPVILITTIYEGVSPEDVESAVTMEIENELSGLKGIKEITSTSAEGMSLIVLEFQPEMDIQEALQRTKDKVDLARNELPTGVEEPVVSEISVEQFPVMIVNVTGTISPVRLKLIADDLEDLFKGIPGVLDVDVLGDLEREIRIEINQDRLNAYGLSIGEILQLVPSENVNVSAGGLETPGTKFNVRIPGEFAKPEQIQTLQVATRDGRPVYLTDIATVRDTFKDVETIARVNGEPSISLSIQKRSGANMIPISAMVSAFLDRARTEVPRGVSFEVTMDRSEDISRMIADLENNIISGLVLVVLVLVLFMGWRTSMIVALAIPMSMLISFSIIYAIGFSLNTIVLFSLILALGMLVDNAIVIVENIYRHIEMGYTRTRAAMKGTAEVAWPVITSTATTIAAFTPLLFWPGIMGDFMKYLPVTLIVTLGSSLFVALVISPTVSAMAAGGKRVTKREGGGDNAFIRGYKSLLCLAMKHRFVVLSLGVLLLIGMLITYGRRGSGTELFPSMDPNRAIVNLRAPQGRNINELDKLARVVEQRIDALPAEQRAEIDYVLTNIGSTGGSGVIFGTAAGPHQANITLVFRDYENRQVPSETIIATLRQRLTDLPGVEVKVEGEEGGPPTGEDVEVRVIGRDFDQLQAISADAGRMIADVRGLVNLRSDFEAAKPELVFVPDRERAVKLGVNTQTVAQFIKTAVFGSKVGTYRQYNDEYDITVRLPVEQRQRIEDLFRLRVPTALGQSIPLSSLGHFEYRAGLGTINRVDRKRVITLTAAAEGRQENAVLADVMERLDPLGRNSLIREDIRDWPAFASEIVNGSGPVSSRIRQQLDDDALDQLRRVAQGQELAAKSADAGAEAWQKLLDKLNAVAINSRDFYTEDGFGLELPAEAQELAARDRSAPGMLVKFGIREAGDNLGDREVARLNRLVLEAAYPNLLADSERLTLPSGYEIEYAGQKEEQDEAQDFLLMAFGFALLLIVMILVAQFNTLGVPLIIMFTVLLSLVGVFGGLLVHDMPFGIIMTGVGVISLAGVVVNNAIVLLDYTRQLQRDGMELVEAAVEAGRTRVRPVLLTAATTILGLLPMATGFSFDFRSMSFATRSENSQVWQSMATVVIYGLGFATVLTLVIVPALYVAIYQRLARWGLGGLKPHDEEDEASQPPPLPAKA